MRYKGRDVDAIAFWSQYVDFPNVKFDEGDTFAPKTVCPNPNHDTEKRHFQVNMAEALVHCFAHCGISGTWEHAVCVIEGLYEKFKVEEAPDAQERHRRQQRARREASKKILKAASGRRVTGYVPTSSKARNSRGATKAVPRDELRYESFLPSLALEFCESRGITDASVAEWNLGWLSEEKRLVIPAKDEINRIRFLIKRSVLPGQNPKYLYSEGFPKTSLLFGACAIDLGMVRSEGLVLVEGSIDTIILHQHGLRIAGGILGTGISESQCRIIEKIARAAGRIPRVILAFDKDSAGIRNIEIAAGKLKKYPLYVMKYPKMKSDPAELTREEAYRQVERAVPAFRFLADNGLSVRRRKEIGFG